MVQSEDLIFHLPSIFFSRTRKILIIVSTGRFLLYIHVSDNLITSNHKLIFQHAGDGYTPVESEKNNLCVLFTRFTFFSFYFFVPSLCSKLNLSVVVGRGD